MNLMDFSDSVISCKIVFTASAPGAEIVRSFTSRRSSGPFNGDCLTLTLRIPSSHP